MSTAVFFHAHPDDETIFTGGTICRMATEGHRAIVVTATTGGRGHDYSGDLLSADALRDRRAEELRQAASILGAEIVSLGFPDSGGDGTAAGGFALLDPAPAADRLAKILVDSAADVLVTYDERGGYGHPDHIQAHIVGMLAAASAGVAEVFWATFDRDRLQSLLALASAFGMHVDDEARRWATSLGVAGSRITTVVDVSGFLDSKRRALRAHATQFPDSSFLWSMPDPALDLLLGTEYFIGASGSGGSGQPVGDWLLD